ncbi:MAG TPA: class I SAM-dependent methyltransferase [Geobacteraceae bacterium]|nr:class I SAM-dependent methyltransferase [Geobacteraceae bacterium]
MKHISYLHGLPECRETRNPEDDGPRDERYIPPDIREIDWNRICWEKRKQKSSPTGATAYWDKRAPAFARNSSKSDYSVKFLRLLEVKPQWTLLDVGCAAGTLAIPLAERVKRITAMDISGNMLALLRERCAKSGISNIQTVQGAWEDDWNALGIGEHDVALASRSLITEDFESALTKLDRAARKRVYVSTIVGDGPHDRRIYRALGRNLNPGPDYIYLYNLLYRMGIRANVNFISYQERNSYESPDDAYAHLSAKLEASTREEGEVLRSYLKENLVCHEGKWMMSYPRKISWAVIWWDKEKA